MLKAVDGLSFEQALLAMNHHKAPLIVTTTISITVLAAYSYSSAAANSTCVVFSRVAAAMVSYGGFRTWFVLGLLGLVYSAPVEVPYGGIRRNETISQEAWIRIAMGDNHQDFLSCL